MQVSNDTTSVIDTRIPLFVVSLVSNIEYSVSPITRQNVSNNFVEWAKCFRDNFVKIFNELYLFSMDFALCLTLDILASLVESKRANFKVKGYNLNYTT